MKVVAIDLHVNLGNEAMRTPSDVASLLEHVAERLRTNGWDSRPTYCDENGNRVAELVLEAE